MRSLKFSSGRLSAVLLGSAMACAAALAHDDAYLDTVAAPNGGQLRMAGAYHLELVVDRKANGSADAPVQVFVTDHANAKVGTRGASATVTLLAGNTRTTVPIVPDGENRLRGSARYRADPTLKAVVALTLANGETVQARFEPLAPRKPAAHKH